MNKLAKTLRQLCETDDDRHWEFDEERQVVSVGQDDRSLEICFTRDSNDYVITSVVLRTAQVTKNAKQWRDFARLAWHRNAENEIVTFAFDKRDRLVGQIRHPVDHLDVEELELYITVLARECSRFGYLLSGSDSL